MKRSYTDILRELIYKLNKVMKIADIKSIDMLTVIMPRKDFNVFKKLEAEISVVKENKVVKYVGLDIVKANVDRIYICLK